ncbi:MAG TPA: tetratricopeptide repeat protein [Opitutaceae bacterium]|nr:tetratricopeptide repeat protein [Opitutaceae bacterium]
MPDQSGAWRRWLAPGSIALAVAGAYANSGRGVFLLDDFASIGLNPTIRRLGALGTVLRPPAEGFTVTARPVLNLSLAIDYALGGDSPGIYHATNALIHLGAALALFGIARRTLGRWRPEAAGLGAWALALLWAVHPLQTESVTYVIQRAESLMGLFYLLTLYGLVRGWLGASVLACLLGMGTKEVMVSAPLVMLLYDRTFLAGSFREAWRRRRSYYLLLAATWAPLIWLAAAAGGSRGHTSGFGAGVAPWTYWMTQGEAVLAYLRLALWPAPLVFDYGSVRIHQPAALAGGALALAAAGATVWALVRAPRLGFRERALGFAGACFFAILAPTSLVPGPVQRIAEHRMYLPLAAVLAAVLIGAGALLPRISRKAAAAAVAAWALALGAATFARNAVYASEVGLWRDTAAEEPAEARPRFWLGNALLKAGRYGEAAGELEAALRLQPRYVDAQEALATADYHLGRREQAAAGYRRVLDWNPGYAEAQDNLGLLAEEDGRWSEAAGRFEEALRLQPRWADARAHLAGALARQGNEAFRRGGAAAAAEAYRRALALDPGDPEVHVDLGLALSAAGRLAEAQGEFEAALRLRPDDGPAHYNLANSLAQAGRLGEAAPHYQAALRADPGNAAARINLGNCLFQLGRTPEAIAQYEAALPLQPGNARLHFDLANALAAAGRLAGARAHYGEALRLRPDFAAARAMLDRLGGAAP